MSSCILSVTLGTVFKAAELDNVDTAILACIGRIPAWAGEYFSGYEVMWRDMSIQDRVLMLTDYFHQQETYID